MNSTRFDMLMKKEITAITLQDVFYMVDLVKQYQLAQKRAERDDDTWSRVGVQVQHADGTSCTMPLDRIGWKQGDRLPMRFELPVARTYSCGATFNSNVLPDTAPVYVRREFRYKSRLDWNGQPVYEEVVP